MSRGRSAIPLALNSRERTVLQSHIGSRSLSRSQHQRIRILLDTSAGKSLSSISRELGLGRMNVRLWRDRFEAGLADLRSFSAGVDGQGVSDRELFDRMLEMLSDLPRSGKPAEIGPVQVQQLVALACRKPVDYGLPHSNWTHELLAQVAIEQGIFKRISGRYVGKLLKNAAPASP